MEIQVNPINKSNLYQVMEVTDYQNGKIIISCPIFSDGQSDPMRPDLFTGATQVNLPNGQSIPVKFKLEAASLTEAIELFPSICKKAIEEIHSKLVQSQIATAGGALNGAASKLDLSKLKN